MNLTIQTAINFGTKKKSFIFPYLIKHFTYEYYLRLFINYNAKQKIIWFEIMYSCYWRYRYRCILQNRKEIVSKSERMKCRVMTSEICRLSFKYSSFTKLKRKYENLSWLGTYVRLSALSYKIPTKSANCAFTI